MALRAGPYTFRYVTYDAASDMLYAGFEPQRRQGKRERTPEDDFLRFDEEGRFIGIILVNPGERLDREGQVQVTLPSGDRARVQGLELELRAAR
ncbi:MAG TPA: DUF2283 domain-containing protein [Solirubrobacterales bacterium]|nr:DUF2283 domain-containing protein [Solirubrobacterales bacterium]